MNDEEARSNDRLRKANPRKQRIDIRPDNPGRDIANNLPALEIEPAALDAFSEINPLPELPGAMADKFTLVTKLEIPKWGRRGVSRKGKKHSSNERDSDDWDTLSIGSTVFTSSTMIK